MNRNRLIRSLKTAFSVTCGVACVLLIVFWVRSYWWRDLLYLNLTTPTAYAVCTSKGELVLLRSYDGNRGQGQVLVLRELPSNQRRPLLWYAEKIEGRTRDAISLPLWMPVLLSTTFAVIPWIPWSKRFSLRTLLIATTLVAVMLGVIIVLSR
jgi:hypothetical protein